MYPTKLGIFNLWGETVIGNYSKKDGFILKSKLEIVG